MMLDAASSTGRRRRLITLLALLLAGGFLAISLLAMACGAGAAYLYLERKIKTKEKLAGFAKALPSLSACDTVNRWAVAAPASPLSMRATSASRALPCK